MVAEQHVGLKLGHCALDRAAKRVFEFRGHLRCEIAVAGGRIRHDIGHATDMKGQLRGVEVDGKDGYARRDVALRVTRGGAAEDGGLEPGY